MNLTKLIYKIVDNPKSLENYLELKDFYNSQGFADLAESFNVLIEARRVDSSNAKQTESDK
jgi:hypothetical protein